MERHWKNRRMEELEIERDRGRIRERIEMKRSMIDWNGVEGWRNVAV